jgi:lysozyme
MNAQGIDISDYQSVDSFHDVAADGISFIFCKATQGINNVQDSFASNRQRIAEVPTLLFGAYHFLDWNERAEAQATKFLQTYQPKSGDLVPMLDIEGITIDADSASNTVSDFISRVERSLNGQKMLLYMDWDTINSQRINTSWFAGHPLWLAQYASSWDIPRTWLQPTIWQKGDTGQVNGICGTVDMDVAVGDLYSLRLQL